MPAAVQGYADAMQEIREQLDDVPADAVFLPCGTGTTQAGVIVGSGNHVPVYGITVARSVERCENEIRSLLAEYRKDDSDMFSVNVLPCPIKYGEKSEKINGIINSLAASDGIFLDPVYNAKSFLGMTEFLEHHPEIRTAVYINTGGTPNLFE